MLGGTCYYYHPWNKNKEMETGRFSDLARSDPTDCSWQWPRGPHQQASGQWGWKSGSQAGQACMSFGVIWVTFSSFPLSLFYSCLLLWLCSFFSPSPFSLSSQSCVKMSPPCFSLDPQSWVRAPPPESFCLLHPSPITRNTQRQDWWMTFSLTFLDNKSFVLLASFVKQNPCQWRESTSWGFTL